MATVKTDIVSALDANGTIQLDAQKFKGNVCVMRSEYTPASADAAGTVIKLGKLPVGARVLPESKVFFEAGQGATMTVKVGDASDDDRYLAAVAPGANATSKALEANALNYTKVTADTCDILLTTGTAALTAAKKIVAEIRYVLN